MSIRQAMCTIVAIFVISACAAAQEHSAPVVKHVPIRSTSPTSGKDMYTAYCAVCHGSDGKGFGPAAAALKTRPTDLTTLAKNYGGKFPTDKVSGVIQGQSNFPAHGTKEMPVWGQLFWSMSHGENAEVQLRVRNLTNYIESMQVK